jgi:DNA/RNA endonuclease G (NUC1)/serine/threonine protein phosphatase PrpC
MSGNLYAELINNTGGNLSALQISYDVEKYRKGSNPDGFRIQLFYSPDGINWINAGSNFLTTFSADVDNRGFATAPGATVNVNNTLSVVISNTSKFYLAWNYSVATGSTTTNAQGLAIDNVSILATAQPTNPSGAGNANPNSVAPSGSTLLTVAVTPGANPPSVNHTVTADLSLIGGSATQTLFDDGTNGDVTANDKIFSFNATVAMGTSGSLKNLPFTVNEVGGLGRIGTGAITLGVLSSTNPSAVGAANPNSVLTGETSVLTVTVLPGSNPTSTNLAVSANLSSIGGSVNQQFFDDGVNGGDVQANDHVFTYTVTVPLNTSAGATSLPYVLSDAQGRSGSGSISLTVQQPPPPPDHLVISQLYGGGGNSGAAFTNDYVELYNPTPNSFNLAGWSLQYASAGGSNWSNKQPLGGIIASGEYFLVKLGSGGANGNPLPQANIEGDINMSATSGKVALVNNSINLNGDCPNGLDPDIVDFVGYGSSASCFEGADHAPAPSAVNAIFRKFNGAQDTNQNKDDFQAGPANPRRTAPIMELGPWVANTEPLPNGFNAPYDSTISVDFSEPVDVTDNWYNISCSSSGQHNSATVASYDNSKGYHITPNTGFQFGEQCTVTIFHTNVHDQDLDDSSPNTDTLFDDYSWTFTVVSDNQLPLAYPSSVHLTMGNPSNAQADVLQFNNYLMEKPAYSLSYNRDKGTPNWVSWHLESDWFGNLARVDTFRADPAIPADWYRVQSTDYFSSGFDRGHMTPNADRDNQNRIPVNQETYLMTNMVPQAPDNNQGPWANMENDLRTLLNGTQNEMYIVSGPLGVGGTGSNGLANTIANGHITVPAFTWKVVLVLPKGDDDVSRVNAATQTIAVLMPNAQGIRNNDWHMYLTTVDNIEALTGYDFFANVPDAIENAIEAGTNGDNPPGTENQFAATPEDTPGSLGINAVSPLANPTFTSQILTPPSHGVLSGTGLNLTYTPFQNYHGPDTFTFKVNDGSHDSNTSTFTLTVTDVNDAPSATDDSVETNEDTPLNITAADLTANDSTGPADESLQTLSITNVSSTAASHGWVTLDNGIITYTPDANYHGPASFTYQVCDNGTTNGASDSQCTTGTVNITVNSVNDNPVAVDDSASTDEDTPVTIDVVANDTDVDGDTRTLQSVGTASHGTVTKVNGQAQYSPAANFNGSDSFTYVVSDGRGGEATGTVNITVNAVNDNPVAVDDSATTNEDTPVTIDVVANDPDVDGDTRTLQSVGTASHGSVTIVGGQAQYSPDADFNGSDSFTYVVADGHGGQATGTVNITVNSVNDNPVAVDDSAATDEDTPVTIDVVANDTDVDGDTRTLQSVGTASHGSVSIVSGQAQYSPAANFHGSDSFTYVVSDGHGGEATGTVNITVNSVNDNPVAGDDAATTNEDMSVLVDVVANDTDVDGDTRTLHSVGTASHGSVSIVGGQAQYSPAQDFNGSDSFTYVVADGHGGEATGTGQHHRQPGQRQSGRS